MRGSLTSKQKLAQLLPNLAMKQNGSAATQNQAFSASGFLWIQGLRQPRGKVDARQHITRPAASGQRLIAVLRCPSLHICLSLCMSAEAPNWTKKLRSDDSQRWIGDVLASELAELVSSLRPNLFQNRIHRLGLNASITAEAM
jgi:hypothetical protein